MTAACGSAMVLAMPNLRVLLIDDQRMFAEAIGEGLVGTEISLLGRCSMDNSRWADTVTSLRPDVVVMLVTDAGRAVGQLVRRIRVAGPETAVVVLADTATALAVDGAGPLAMLGMDVTMERLVRVVKAVHSGYMALPEMECR